MKWSSKAASIFFLLFSIGASAKITPMSVVFGPNPSREEKIINTALSTIDFYDGGDGNFYANGRLISFTMEAQLFPNSIQMSMNDCADASAYSGSEAVKFTCLHELADSIRAWGIMARNKNISDRAWRLARIDSTVDYNPVKYQIFFARWVGMARVYASRGY